VTKSRLQPRLQFPDGDGNKEEQGSQSETEEDKEVSTDTVVEGLIEDTEADEDLDKNVEPSGSAESVDEPSLGRPAAFDASACAIDGLRVIPRIIFHWNRETTLDQVFS
jgi:hypothetical protein